jgi:hypothetical protein
MIFCFGARRSGTYLLERLLSAHPRIAAVPSETHLISHGIAPLLERFHHGVRSAPRVGVVYGERDKLLDAARDFCDVVFAEFDQPEAAYLVERTPLHAEHAELIAELYPDARFIHIIRDGRDVAASLLEQRWGPATIEEAAQEWSRGVRSGRALAGHAGYHEVRYERLLADPGGELRDVFDTLGLEAGANALEAAARELKRPLNVGPSAQIGSEKWRSKLDSETLTRFEAEAGDLLSELGYPESGAGAGKARSRLGAARDRAGALLGGAPKGGQTPFRKAPRGDPRFNDPHDAINALLDVGRRRASARIAEILSDDARVRVVSPDGVVDAKGPAAVEALSEALCEDEALRGELLRDEMLLSGSPSAVASLTFALPDGTRAERILAVTSLRGLAEQVLLCRIATFQPDA